MSIRICVKKIQRKKIQTFASNQKCTENPTRSDQKNAHTLAYNGSSNKKSDLFDRLQQTAFKKSTFINIEQVGREL